MPLNVPPFAIACRPYIQLAADLERCCLLPTAVPREDGAFPSFPIMKPVPCYGGNITLLLDLEHEDAGAYWIVQGLNHALPCSLYAGFGRV